MADDTGGKPEAGVDVAAGGGRTFDDLLSRITGLENAVACVAEAESGSAESRYLRKALAEAFSAMDSLTDTVRKIQAEIDTMKRKLARYESENMPSSTTSLYNRERGKFRARRGENPAGGPGEKIGRGDDGGGGQDDDGGGGGNPASASLTKNGKKLGPPVGHKGASHNNKATLPPMRYFITAAKCNSSGLRSSIRIK